MHYIVCREHKKQILLFRKGISIHCILQLYYTILPTKQTEQAKSRELQGLCSIQELRGSYKDRIPKISFWQVRQVLKLIVLQPG